ncbi:hypothetical protein [Aureibacter tunicatorum]|uniref:Phage tail tube protein n=1 Tax=Aureibacter tunicatorum TaxID=866807 RepID=A0AAE3XRT5_9BACT|nr:hypothetical protein [Aureibacter tunicatorum]MDR6241967.1 hypothetical protein [Aureibacter tunicatorum]BDD07520.1 hypothetical protein AUTU_50030 [Aureibacter tunicatorum]
MKFAPLVNGRTYSWSDITVNILGNPVSGITAVSYEDKQEMENVYGAGEQPVARGYGKIEATGSITLLVDEVEALMNASESGRLQEIPEFDIVVAYETSQGEIKTHTLKNCKFKSNKREMKTGDMKMESALELLISHIEWK